MCVCVCVCVRITHLVGNEDVELQHPLSPLASLHPHPPPLPDGGRLQGVVVGQMDKQLNAELIHSIDH